VTPIRHPAGTHALDLEAELAVVIGRRASRVGRRTLPGAASPATPAANDVTARDWQGQAKALRPGEKGDGQWLRAPEGSPAAGYIAAIAAATHSWPNPSEPG
jgi:2-keto-4-pentenoate hydratase/2-oxohepta-3-ene-1,7-dioic acid hydratase in catechol pathway